ncbi:MAG: phage/plasmid primase, P4 family [Thiothrix sp.]|uniref:DNA primase family protein n=1 Tax=Thiothrix sp. TaxID=1032 RepID=UPI00262EF2CE|nr:phage/plasmid primase, P4 family [Thiothrix sp.]MDD5393152.1 phage/plasmid primase, P4 family [Thiothrix sp.]
MSNTPHDKQIDGSLPQNKLASDIAKKLITSVRWDDSTQQWFTKKGYVWKPIRDIVIQRKIKGELDKAKSDDGYSFALISAIEKFLKIELQVEEWEVSRHLLPMANGVLNLQTGKLESYGNRLFTWQLPYAFDPLAICPTVEHYLTTVTGNDVSMIMFLKAWMRVVLTGRYDLQKYLEIIGSGGTGKSTFIELCTLLVGDENRVVTDLKRLEGSRFESANLKGKRLVVITDSSQHRGEVANLKAIVGSDPLPYEKKGIQAAEPFIYNGLLMIAANEAIQSSDYTSGLSRRKIPAEFNIRATDEDKNRYRKQGGIIKVMQAEMPGLVNMLLSINEDDVIDLINNPQGSMLRQKIETEINTNPILGWLDDCVIPCEKGEKESGIGNAEGDYSTHLYPSYVKWCSTQGRQPKSMTSFSSLVIDNCKTYGIDTAKHKTSTGMVLLKIRLRTSSDYGKPLLISSKSEGLDSKSEGLMQGKTRESAEFAGYDGLESPVKFNDEMEVAL